MGISCKVAQQHNGEIEETIESNQFSCNDKQDRTIKANSHRHFRDRKEEKLNSNSDIQHSINTFPISLAYVDYSTILLDKLSQFVYHNVVNRGTTHYLQKYRVNRSAVSSSPSFPDTRKSQSSQPVAQNHASTTTTTSSQYIVRHSLFLYVASSVVLALCYLTVPIAASDTVHPM